MAAPVRGVGDEVLAALTVSGPTVRLGPERLAALGPELTREADALSERLTSDAHRRMTKGHSTHG